MSLGFKRLTFFSAEVTHEWSYTSNPNTLSRRRQGLHRFTSDYLSYTTPAALTHCNHPAT